ncbi:MAG TPA: excinuclease ABC subunit UvrC [Geminicoccaceae bacterium]|jgi:excinuclease ABC subunit C|nr:excinuclease ABC subunit UvrC [Geminicoccaceae bacterium]
MSQSSNRPISAEQGTGAAASAAVETGSRQSGAALIHAHVASLPNGPGVYRMLDAKGEVLYVGKAKSLKKRVLAYTKPAGLSARLQRMVTLTRGLEVVSTANDVEALLLECNLIKRHRPPYNIVLRDDKSFPYIYVGKITPGQPFPRIGRHRGAKRKDCDYFGPFASSGAVNETLSALLRAFPIRSCPDSIFSNRTRPCLQYQIKRCTAPCVGRIEPEPYAQLVEQTRAFLSGRSGAIQEQLQAEMASAAGRLDFEQAAAIRDRLKALAHISTRQGINVSTVDDADVIALAQDGGQACVQVFFYRSGQNYGNRAYYPSHAQDALPAELIDAFLGQFYSDRPPPKLILLSHPPASEALLAEALAVRAGRRVELACPRRGERRQLVVQAETNARLALARKLAESSAQAKLLQRLGERLGLPEPPARVEVYDNSHIMGTDALGAFIVAGPEGLNKSGYRRFLIRNRDLTPGDDYAMMREVLGRRFVRLQREDPERQSGQWPDLVIIDGGPGQLSAALETLGGCGVDGVPVLAIAKGPDRDAGRETLYLPERAPLKLDPRDPVLYFLQRLRDEAHRFAITSHRNRRGKAVGRSALDRVPGVGGRRKKALLSHFGSVRAIETAGLLDLERVPGINKAVARAVYDAFHDGS